MKIVVLCGDDEAASRSRYLQIVSGVKKKNWQVVRVSVQDKYSLAERLSSHTLFEQETLFVVDNAGKLPIVELKWLAKNYGKYSGSLLLYQKGNLPVALKNALPKDTAYEKFDLPKVIFKFLESFYPGNQKNALRLLEEFLLLNPPEVIIAVLGRHLRDVYLAKIDGFENMPDWRLGKLKKQAEKFTTEALTDTINTLSDIDYSSKTSSVNVKFLLELLIIEKLG